jgi:hypothetical protein
VQARRLAASFAQAADASANFEPSTSGRIGPRTVRLDEASAAGDIRIDDLTVESLSNFSSARATTAIFKASAEAQLRSAIVYHYHVPEDWKRSRWLMQTRTKAYVGINIV